MNTSRLLTILIVVVIILAGIQWSMNISKEVTITSEAISGDTSRTNVTQVPLTPSTPSTETTPASSVSTDQLSTINKPIKNAMHNITIETNKGTIIIETYDADAPNTVKNFVTLAEKGFYNNLIFHRVIKDFMIQGGDPTGTGMGGPGYKFADELNPATPSYKAGYTRGTVAMANSGPNTNGSQFFIMHKDYPLPNNYTIFGKVIQGIDIVDTIANTKTGANDKPVADVVMKKVTVSTK